MKIIHVITGLNQGGAEAMLERLVLAGRRINPEIEQRVVSLSTAGIVGRRLQDAGVPVESMNMGITPRSFFGLARLTRQLRPRGGATIVQTWLWHADLVGGLCARAAGNRRLVWNLRNSMPAHAATKLASRAVARLCSVLSWWVPEKILCNSVAAREAHVSLGYARERFVIIPNGFDLGVFARSAAARGELRTHWGVDEHDVLVGMVARVDPLKDHATFIRCAAMIAAGFPHVRFVLVGEGVTSDASIRDLIAQAGLVPRFILEERRDDVQRVMSALDVFCLASKSEGFPNVLGEAMACATPAVATDVGDVRDILRDERLVASVGSAESLARCVSFVVGMGESGRHQLGLRQRHEVETRFDIARVWNMYRDLYAAL